MASGGYGPGRVLVYALLALAALYFLLPLAVMLITSLKDMDEIRSGTLLSLPAAIDTTAWTKAWGSACTGVSCDGLKGYFWNSVRLVVPAVTLSTLIGALNGYVLTQWRFRGANLFFGLLLIGTMIPFQVILLPMARTLGALGLAGSLAGLMLVHVVYGIAFTTLFFRNAYISLPDELVKAARIDGAGFWVIFLRIILPLSGPIIVVYSAGDQQPVTVALNNLVNTSTGVKAYNVDMAAAIIAALPTLLVYVVAGNYFVRGLTAGAVKG
jgi:glucose/mannose transport system permease protein